ncbi:uncharacterized protein LOC103955535 isoform X1 [Pyrus x bretschneideri]|uniref:uncharacterized protein LOC103955535 isoform X1 n=2 Tax=Pyrus x bretschneideri TaxID=225117 RepID=UPI002030D348|nr:uncharacterized protein LOC103955535 isoform X1 [Pyrus x bretschneideri]
MVGWQRHVQSLIRHVGKRVENHGYTSAANFSSSSHFLKLQTPSYQTISRPLHQYFQHLGISSSRNLLADSFDGAPHQSSVTPLSASSGEKIEEQNQKSSSRPSQVQFVLKGMNQSPNKVNLVAKLVCGMRVEDALLQLQVTDKQAAKTVYQALHSARADATYNHGLDPERLLVAGAFVGKGFLGFRKNRLYYHGKSNDGTKVRPNYQLTVTLREIYPEEEEEIAKQRADNFLYIKKRLRLTKQENKFVSHHLIGNHIGKGSTSQQSGMAS